MTCPVGLLRSVGRPGDPLTRGIPMHTPSPCGGLPTPALTCAGWGVHLPDNFPDRGPFFLLRVGGGGSPDIAPKG